MLRLCHLLSLDAKREIIVKLLVFFLLMTSAITANSAEIVFYRGSPEKIANYVGMIPFDWLPRILIRGDISPGDENAFESALDRAESTGSVWAFNRSVRLDSYGGDVATAMLIADQIRKHRVSTIVMDGSNCASACILILAGGTSRVAQDQARLGLHRPYFSNTASATKGGYEQFKIEYDAVLSRYRAFLSRMGIGNDLVEAMMLIPSNEIRWIDRSFALQVNLLGDDPADAEWQRAKRIEQKGEACVKFDDQLLSCYSKFGFDSDYCHQLLGPPPRGCM